MRRNFLIALAAVCGVSLVPQLALAQAYPTKPIRIIVPATPGGTSDIFARAIALKLQESLGKPVLVEYKPGASTNIGTDYVAKSAPDGYTLLINGITLSVNPVLYSSLPFSPTKDLAAITEVASLMNVVTVHPSIPVNNLKELVALMKKDPGKMNYGTPGVGSSGYLSAELLAMKTGAKVTHVAYQGNAQATTDHIGGTLQVGFVNLPVALQFVKAGKLKALAVTSAKRSPLLPDVPTVAEALGIPDYELNGWFGLLAPAKTPPDIIARLQEETAKALKDPALIEIIKVAGGDVVGGTAAQFDARIKKDSDRLTEVIKFTGGVGSAK
ncbi:MAG: tripartite tricarboxylate transporter substrate binding protein [Polaromonas sp.]|uniref:Bug family tripartite tricarboxylate transporter substrate binding protein n=1 Tax=Polaromonas sp. TaxID=1869339 RepID=UPI0025E6CDB5|nr:tripartite tricarboxylate transporter substrate binding protein [Polaromonas sp.]MBI2725216.1 tripartite tricarboxylate transporter substrate binding protein [Polaromonas sp.]